MFKIVGHPLIVRRCPAILRVFCILGRCNPRMSVFRHPRLHRPHAVLACMRSSLFLRRAVAMASETLWYSAEGWIRLCRGTTMSEHLR